MSGGWRRRTWLAAAASLPLGACAPRAEVTGALTGTHPERGHLLRHARATGDVVQRRASVVIAGAGVAGLAAARALRLAGIDDFVLLDLEDEGGGNSRGTRIAGIDCPLGAHYLPVPGDAARDVQDLLEELGLRRRVAGRWSYDERHLCHSPQERVFFQGHWQDGLLPVQDVGAATLAQYARFARRIEALSREARYTIPVSASPLAPAHLRLDALPFTRWLAAEGFDDPLLRWYLEYCCRDDYGAGPDTVSAWAGVHYFASRHGFHAPGEEGDRDAVLTWPEGNAWLSRRLAAACGERVRPRRVVARVATTKDGAAIDAIDTASGSLERWEAKHVVVALPAFIAARVLASPPAWLVGAARAMRYAPWVVANLHLREPLADRPGAAPSWDNVVHGARGLGYVDARHQALDPRPGPTVLTWYHAPGEQQRHALLQSSWQDWHRAVIDDLGAAHPDLAGKVTRVEVTRYGHAMRIPVPGTRAQLQGVALHGPRVSFAHADWAGYSVFEEAFTSGHAAGVAAARRLGRTAVA
ncbi:NAD(P)-binding protein [Ramlibacter algicola]|uniref:FAD-dependent oxidoreductase n=1 Tax=Ramlibacter algicola TaxID=2795217 RepID=A0A934UPW5_9BURK|nr:NAD(P)-binding protein [Ramlibacter algicola]MBK0391510.1 FAD-dependent oxidoreductase [Ramlibacter algicola]